MIIYAATEHCSPLARHTIRCCQELGYNSVLLSISKPTTNESLVPVVPISARFPGVPYMTTRLRDYRAHVPFLDWAPRVRLMLLVNQSFENVIFLGRGQQHQEFLRALRKCNQELEERARIGVNTLPRPIRKRDLKAMVQPKPKLQRAATGW